MATQDRQRRVKMGQSVVTVGGHATLQHKDDLLGDYQSTCYVDSVKFQNWAVGAKSFSFDCNSWSYVARNETRSGQPGYWYAFRKINGKTSKIYIGRTADISFARLVEVGKQFVEKEKQVKQDVLDNLDDLALKDVLNVLGEMYREKYGHGWIYEGCKIVRRSMGLYIEDSKQQPAHFVPDEATCRAFLKDYYDRGIARHAMRRDR